MEEMDNEIFGGDDDDEEEVGTKEPIASQNQTQPAVKGFLSDIFGDDDDDDDVKGTGSGLRDSDDDLNNSSDDDVTSTKRKKLGKKKDTSSSSASKKKKSKEVKEGKKGKDKDKIKKRKSDSQITSSGRVIKKPTAPRERDPNAAPATTEGDEYDSEEDVVATKDDRRFLADEDNRELAGVMAEYEDDDQNFDDERPRKKGRSEAGRATKELDPFSETLQAMKKPKAVEIGDQDKAKLAGDLLMKMSMAESQDDILVEKKQPAVNKLNMLKNVQAVVNVKTLQNTLLDHDILSVFASWLKLCPDKSLPSLTLRTTIYEMLAQLPCQSEHLKRHADGMPTIGMVIVSLLKSKLETEDNKRKLRALIERWARPVYGKQTDARNANYDENPEIRAASMSHSAALLAAAETKNRSVDAFGVSTIVDTHKRVRTPYSNGFLYTVKPDAKVLDKTEMVGSLGARRDQLLKKMKDTKGVVGRKANPRAMDMAMSGRNKS